MKEQKCCDYKCGQGKVDFQNPVHLMTSLMSFGVAYPCNVCGRLHSRKGEPIFNHLRQRVFFQAGKLFSLDRAGNKIKIY